ncbi:MAG: hypothetical protein LBI57_03565 [Helicobacteraceae bacterium]|jgi:hypothetical protein|nr:hypothetical protein [Helicobacteraceae bacterium]
MIQTYNADGTSGFILVDPSVFASGYYSAIGDVLPSYVPGGAPEAFQYKTEANASLTVTEITNMDERGARSLGASAEFEPIW